nr:UTRA domain-containing protein [Sandaracinobacteroides sayramensis]
MHERIRQDFEARILSGELAPGERLPTEQALMAHYGCARMTVNKALSALAVAGLVERRKKAGSFVARPRLHSMVLDIPDLAQQLTASGRRHAFRLTGRRLRPAAVADAGLVAQARRLLQLEGVHQADGLPFALEQRLISAEAVPAALEADFEAQPPGSWLLAHVPWTEAETRILAVGASEAEAAALAVPAGTPCLCVERRTWRLGEGITFVRQLFPGDSYDMVARFGPAPRG